MARVTGKRDHSAFGDPREEYVFTTQSMDEVIVRWDGQRGHTRASILSRRTREKWDEQKENFARVLDGERAAAFARKVADSDSDELVKAVKRHRQLGLSLQQFALGKQTLIDRKDGRKEMIFEDRGEAIPVSSGDIIRAIKEGVTIERKALGLADQIVQVQFAEAFVTEVWTTISKYVDDPAIIRNVGRELEGHLHRQFELLEAQRNGMGTK